MNHESKAIDKAIEHVPVDLERDPFLRDLIRELTGTLQDVIGLEDASGFISVVGQRMGDKMDEKYKKALNVESLSREQVRDVLIDLKRRIKGDFYLIEEDDEKIVLGNRKCPFAEQVHDRPALCMMTSNVFGVISAKNLGYSKVVLEETISQGAPGCRVVVYIKPTPASKDAQGKEYFQ